MAASNLPLLSVATVLVYGATGSVTTPADVAAVFQALAGWTWSILGNVVYVLAPNGSESGSVVVNSAGTALWGLFAGSCAEACGRPAVCPCTDCVGDCGCSLECPLVYGGIFANTLLPLVPSPTVVPPLPQLTFVCPSDRTDGCGSLPTTAYTVVRVPGVTPTLRQLGFCGSGVTTAAGTLYTRADGTQAVATQAAVGSLLTVLMPNTLWANPLALRVGAAYPSTTAAATAFAALSGTLVPPCTTCCCNPRTVLAKPTRDLGAPYRAGPPCKR
jgi:hypothetical protein